MSLLSSPSSAIRDHVAAAGWTLFVLVLLLVPQGDGPTLPLPPGSDKVAHGLLFWGEALLLLRSFRWLPRLARPAITALVLAALLAFATELAQLGIAGRSFDRRDLWAGGAGILFAGLWVAWRRDTLKRTG